MKAIELTEEHESKLLEMCKTLFPEYLVPTIQPNGYINIAETEDSSDYVDLIHWFEFCLMHIVPKLLKSHLDKEEFYLYINDSNPINYLYKYFKN